MIKYRDDDSGVNYIYSTEKRRLLGSVFFQAATGIDQTHRYYVRVFSAAERFCSIGWVSTEDEAFRELKAYDDEWVSEDQRTRT